MSDFLISQLFSIKFEVTAITQKNQDEKIFDHIIVGAGILGTATAKYLQEMEPEKKILLIDKYPGVGMGNTGKSNACFRNIFSNRTNIDLCNASISYYKHLEENGTNIELKEVGYLWLLTKEQYNLRTAKFIPHPQHPSTLISFLDFLKLNEVKYKVFDQNELKNILPELQVEKSSLDKSSDLTDFSNIEYGLYGLQCGTLDPGLLVNYYYESFRANKGYVLFNTEVRNILFKEKGKSFDEDYFPTMWRKSEVGAIQIKNLKDNSEDIIRCKNLVITTGAWIQQLFNKIGINTGIIARKRQLFRIKNVKKLVLNTNFKSGYNSIPFIILPIGGVFLKPIAENNSVDVGTSDYLGRRIESVPSFDHKKIKYNPYKNTLDNPKGELEFYATDILPVLKTYFPNVFDEHKKIDHPSAGMYAYSLDKSPIIDKYLDNLFFCSGASGSGIMKGDAIARINVANILNKTIATLFNGTQINVADFSIENRNLETESLVI